MQGWECPRCHAVYAPWVASCTKCAAAPAPVPSTPRFPPSPNPTAPWPRRYGTGDFPEFEPQITCFGFGVHVDDRIPRDTIGMLTPVADTPHDARLSTTILG